VARHPAATRTASRSGVCDRVSRIMASASIHPNADGGRDISSVREARSFN